MKGAIAAVAFGTFAMTNYNRPLDGARGDSVAAVGMTTQIKIGRRSRCCRRLPRGQAQFGTYSILQVPWAQVGSIGENKDSPNRRQHNRRMDLGKCPVPRWVQGKMTAFISGFF